MFTFMEINNLKNALFIPALWATTHSEWKLFFPGKYLNHLNCLTWSQLSDVFGVVKQMKWSPMIPSIALLSIADLGGFGLAHRKRRMTSHLLSFASYWLFCNTLDRHVKDKSQKAYPERKWMHHLHGMANKGHHGEGKRLQAHKACYYLQRCGLCKSCLQCIIFCKRYHYQ